MARPIPRRRLTAVDFAEASPEGAAGEDALDAAELDEVSEEPEDDGCPSAGEERGEGEHFGNSGPGTQAEKFSTFTIPGRPPRPVDERLLQCGPVSGSGLIGGSTGLPSCGCGGKTKGVELGSIFTAVEGGLPFGRTTVCKAAGGGSSFTGLGSNFTGLCSTLIEGCRRRSSPTTFALPFPLDGESFATLSLCAAG